MSAECWTCAHYNREAFRRTDGKIVRRKGKVARCLFDVERLNRKLPASVDRPILPGRHMLPDEGRRCPQWTKIKDDAK